MRYRDKSQDKGRGVAETPVAAAPLAAATAEAAEWADGALSAAEAPPGAKPLPPRPLQEADAGSLLSATPGSGPRSPRFGGGPSAKGRPSVAATRCLRTLTPPTRRFNSRARQFLAALAAPAPRGAQERHTRLRKAGEQPGRGGGDAAGQEEGCRRSC